MSSLWEEELFRAGDGESVARRLNFKVTELEAFTFIMKLLRREMIVFPRGPKGLRSIIDIVMFLKRHQIKISEMKQLVPMLDDAASKLVTQDYSEEWFDFESIDSVGVYGMPAFCQASLAETWEASRTTI